MRVLVLGADGYLGWPTAMALSAAGHEVTVVDNYLKRNIMRQHGLRPLLKTPDLSEKVLIWNNTSNPKYPMICEIGDLCNSDFTYRIIRDFYPDSIVHFAEQPSAPYSMLTDQTSRLTINNNLNTTMNIALAMRAYCPTAHLVKLGTMGEYGTPNIDIEEGWIDIRHNGREDKFLYPRQAGSLYHTTKVMDTDLLWFYVRNSGLRVTDLMQGPVYGIFTEECELPFMDLLPPFYYDEMFGTVLNRFIVQAVSNIPLTVYGKGGQTRGYINIQDTVKCIQLAVENPASPGELKIFNQFTETFTVNELAEKVKAAGESCGLSVPINHVPNPRKEQEEHYYNPKHTGLLDLGLEPNKLTLPTLRKMIMFVMAQKHRIQKDQISLGVTWQ